MNIHANVLSVSSQQHKAKEYTYQEGKKEKNRGKDTVARKKMWTIPIELNWNSIELFKQDDQGKFYLFCLKASTKYINIYIYIYTHMYVCTVYMRKNNTLLYCSKRLYALFPSLASVNIFILCNSCVFIICPLCQRWISKLYTVVKSSNTQNMHTKIIIVVSLT